MFPFEPLDANVDSIRLLTLLPLLKTATSGADEICCTLEHRTFASNPTYDALSYAWGNETASKTIKVNDHEVHVSDSLFSALQNFRTEAPRALWVDRLCVNLTDLEERAYQVTLMPYIYSRAQIVLAWLGKAAVPFTKRELEEMKMLETAYATTWAEENCKVIADSLYWSRRWIVQEIVLAKDIRFYLGKGLLTIHTFGLKMGVIDYEKRCDWIKLITQQTEHRNSVIQRLDILLDLFSDLQCLEPRDKIFSLLGCADDVAQDMIEVDYEVDYIDLYAKLIEYHQQSKPIPSKGEVLLWASIDRPWSVSIYQGGVSDGIERSACLVAFSHSVQRSLDGLVDKSRAVSALSSAPTFYVVRGVFAGRIVHVGSTYSQFVSSWKSNKEWQAALRSKARQPQGAARNWSYFDESRMEELRRADAAYYRSALSWDENHVRSIRNVDSVISYGYQHSADAEFVLSAEATADDGDSEPRQFLATNGIIGFAPPGAKEGDLVYSFWECNLGFVVRKVADDQWMIVGRADLSVQSLEGIIHEAKYTDALNYGTNDTSFARSSRYSQKDQQAALQNMLNFRLDLYTLQMLTG